VVTASGAEAVPIKLQKVLFKYFPYLTMKDVIIAEQKGLIIGDVMIDDAPHNLRDFTGKKILFNQPHNRSFNAADSEIQRVDGWGEIYEIIKQEGEKD
jgi:5'(3')-deoxyribonucleotidase